MTALKVNAKASLMTDDEKAMGEVENIEEIARPRRAIFWSAVACVSVYIIYRRRR